MKQKSKKLPIILISLLTLLLIYNGISFWHRLVTEDEPFIVKTESMMWKIHEKDYQLLLTDIKTNENTPGVNMKEFQEYKAVADYFESVFLQKAYASYGDTENAKKYEEKAKSCEEGMGEYAYTKEDINKMLEMK